MRADWLRTHFPDRLYLEASRTHRPHEDAFLAGALTLASSLDLPVVASNDVRFLARGDFEAHEARVCIHAGRVLADPKRPRDYSPDQYLKTPEEMAALFADLPELIENSVELAKRCNLELSFGKYFLPAFPVPASYTLDSFIRDERARRSRRSRLAKHAPASGYTREDYERRLETELDVIVQMGFPGYFLIVADFINWAKQHDIPVGPGSRLGRRIAGRLCARHHRSRSAALRPAVRALSQSRARFAAGLRRRLLHGPARRSHRLRRREIRTRPRQPDHHIRHDGGEGRAARHRPRARHALRAGRPHRQAAAEDTARSFARGRTRPFCEIAQGTRSRRRRIQVALRERRGGQGTRRPRAQARRPDAQRRPARRRRRHCARTVERLRADVLRRRRRRTRHAVRQGRRRGGRSRQVRFPRPSHAHDHRLGREGDQRKRATRTARRCSTSPRCRSTTRRRYALLKRCHTTAIFQLESRGMRDLVKKLQPDTLRGHHRARRAVPSGPAAVGHGRRLHRAQARARGRQLSACAARADPEADLRRHRLSGTGDADRAGARRLFARRRRPAAPRDGQEETRGDGAAARHVRERRREQRHRAAPRERDLRSDGEVRRVRLQQVALGRVRAGRVPDRVAEGALPGRVHGRGAVGRHGQHRQGRQLPCRSARDDTVLPSDITNPVHVQARDEAIRMVLPYSPRATSSARPEVEPSGRTRLGGRQGRRPRRGRIDCRSAHRRRISATLPISAGASTRRRSTSACSKR